MDHSAIRDIFDFVSVLGTGGFGKVWHAVDKASGEDVAVKVVEVPEGPSGVEAHRMVSAEISSLESVVHENVLQLREVYRQGRVFYIVTEYCSGGELLDRVADRLYSEGEAREVVLQLCQALAYLHARGIVHRDLKCENILTARDSRTRVKLADFGLAARKADGPLNRVCGSLLHVAPEVLRCRSNAEACYDERVDLWSLGVLLYIILSGRAPFQGEDVDSLVACIEKDGVEFPTRQFGYVSADAKGLITGLLTKDPDRRLTVAGVLAHPWMATARALSPRQPAAWLSHGPDGPALHEGQVAEVLGSPPWGGGSTSPPTSPSLSPPHKMRAGEPGGRPRRRSRGEEVLLDLVHSIKWLRGSFARRGLRPVSPSGTGKRPVPRMSMEDRGSLWEDGVTCDGGAGPR